MKCVKMLTNFFLCNELWIYFLQNISYAWGQSMKARMRFFLISLLSAAVLFGPESGIRLYAREEGNKKLNIKDESNDLETDGWRIRDFKPYVKSIKDLQKLNKEYSENLLKLSMDECSAGLGILENMENEVNKLIDVNKQKKHLNERFYWQEIDRKNGERRLIALKKLEAKMKAVTYLTKAIDYLDQVQNAEIRKEPRYMDFKIRLYRTYVSTQYDLQNFKPCIPILERYITLTDKTAKDVWAYKYMTSCYAYMERMLAKHRHASEDEINSFKNKKNRSMLQAVELRYGVDSPQYKQMQEIVQEDEKKSVRINNFK
jgi:hypothetical protein